MADQSMEAGSDLYRQMLAFDYEDDERADLMRKVWEPTPWIVDAYTGSPDDDRTRAMIEWCHERFGDESYPIHGRSGQWHRGGVTLYGWTWFGFATEPQMREFVAAWPITKAPSP